MPDKEQEQTSYLWGGPDGQYTDKNHHIPSTATTTSTTEDYNAQPTSIESAWRTTRFVTETSYVTIPIPTKDSLTSPPPTKTTTTTTVALWSPDGGSGEFVVRITVVITVARGADSTGSTTFLTSTTSSATNSRLSGSGSGSDKGEVGSLQPWDQWSQGHRAGVVITALVGFLVVVGLGFILWMSCMVAKRRRRALYDGDNESWEMMSVSNAKREDAMMHGALLSEEGGSNTVKKVLSGGSSQVGSVRESADRVEDEIVNDRRSTV